MNIHLHDSDEPRITPHKVWEEDTTCTNADHYERLQTDCDLYKELQEELLNGEQPREVRCNFPYDAAETAPPAEAQHDGQDDVDALVQLVEDGIGQQHATGAGLIDTDRRRNRAVHRRRRHGEFSCPCVGPDDDELAMFRSSVFDKRDHMFVTVAESIPSRARAFAVTLAWLLAGPMVCC
uniref:Uncharacterized protein n=1 Tax=Anopheles merus TaxID=30066 RepID=A0A182VJW9_ANOME